MKPTVWRRRLTVASPWVTALCLGFFAEPARPDGKAILRFGVIAEEANEPDRMLRTYTGLLTELRSRLAPREIGVAPIVITSDLAELAEKLKRGEVDMVIESIFPTITLKEQSGSGIVPRLTVIRRGQREYHSVFFARKGGRIKTLEDLRGRTLVLQALRSTSAFAVPKAELARRGIPLVPAGESTPPRGGALYLLAAAEINQAIWVVSGKGDAGAFSEGDWAALPDKVRSELTIFHETRPLLRGLLSVRSGLDPKIAAVLEETLLRLHQDTPGQAALTQAEGITRFDQLTAKDRNDIDEWSRSLKKVWER